ncbi:MAG: cytochrome c3 family protein [Candidatus Tectimicrobiota bacterium]
MRTGQIVGWLLAGTVAAVGAYWFSASGEPAVVQPINFNHEEHLSAKRASGPITCNTCHKFYRTRQSSGRPGVAVCASCHTTTKPKSPEMEKLRRFIDRKQEIPWRRVYKLPEHVFYSHRTHVVDAKLPCATCHGPVETQRKALTRPLQRISMAACMDCHRARNVTNDCNACHK